MNTVSLASKPVIQRAPAAQIGMLQMQALALLLGACVFAHSGWMSKLLTLYLAAVIAARVWWHSRLARAIPTLIRAPLLLLTYAIVLITTGSPLGRDGGAALLLSLIVLKLVETRGVRDGRVVVAAVFFVAMTEFLFNQGLLITLYVGFVSLCAFATLTLLRKYPDAEHSAPTLTLGLQAALRSIARIALAALPLAAAMFVFFPRLGEPLWGAPWRGNEGVTGIGDEMRPGMLSKLWNDDTPAFRVSFSGRMPKNSDLYWRGPVLWNFDGSTWSRARWIGGGDVIPFRYSPESVIRYEVLLEATEKNWYFPLDLPLQTVPGATLMADGQMITQKPIIAPKRLNFESATQFVFDDTPARGHRFAALRLPPGSNPRAMALAKSWRAEGKSDIEVIAAAMKLFNDSFVYSLEPPPLAPERSVDDFLFETKTGYCEHFSSSFTFLMRAAGIPARVVTGYLGGYWNRSGEYLLVRNSDAHAWAEVWLQGRGWVRTDPTSAVAPERIMRGNNADALPAAARWYHSSWAARLLDRSDRVARWWRQRIVDFDSLRQRQMLTPLGVDDADLSHLVTALAIAGALAMMFGAWWSMRGLQQRMRDPLLRAWRQFGRRLAKAGVVRSMDEGPIDFSQRAARLLPHAAGLILSLGKTFTRLRYDPANSSEVEATEELIRALKKFRVRVRS
jgi:protein-glutamine gamma-glutamyltransferase